MIDKNKLYEDLERLVAMPSISGTDQEVTAAVKIEEMLKELPYFRENPDQVMRVEVKDDPYGRFLPAAYLKAPVETSDTIILTGHYDVVDVEEYGRMRDDAFDIKAITAEIGELPIDDSTRADLESGNWYFGRGTADMKFGHALCIELLRYYSGQPDRKANFLYVGVCGEETNSEGMLAALPFFNEFAAQNGLRYRLLLLTECFMLDGAEENVKYMQYGASGKIMPMFFCAGAATHGEEPLLGLDASLMSAEVYRLMHLNTDFCQQNHGITTAPPAGLKQQDMKQTYSLSTALYAASYYNIATISLDPAETMARLREVAEEAFENTIKLVEKRAAQMQKLTGKAPAVYRAEPCVKTYNEIYDAAAQKYDGDLAEYLRSYAAELRKENPELQDISVKLVKKLYEMAADKRPMIIVSFIPPYYPDVNVDLKDGDTAKMLSCADKIADYAREKYGETLKKSEYYGISDLCYTWLAEGMNFDDIFDNLAGLNSVYDFPSEELKKFKVPGIVIGGYGKDLHKYTERLEKRYNFEVLPDLYIKYIDMFLE